MPSLTLGRRLGALMTLLYLAFGVPAIAADAVSQYQDQIDAAHAKLAEWAASADTVAAVKAANAQPDTALNNGQWAQLSDTAPEVTAITSTALSKQLGAWKQAEGLNKLFLRDKSGRLVAGPNKPLIYNVSKRPTFKNAITGEVWHANKVKPDPTTQLKAIQVSVPVFDGDAVIGILHSSIIVR